MDQETRDAFADMKGFIKSENEHQNKALEEHKDSQEKSFDDFKVNHDKVSRDYWETVLDNKKTLVGNGNADGGLVAKSVGHSKDIGINRQLIMLAITLILGTAVILLRTEISKVIFG